MIHSLEVIVQALQTSFIRTGGDRNFGGVVLANWQPYFPAPVLNELLKYITALGLETYVELSDPEFLTETESRQIDFSLIEGVICRNGTILPNGERRNFYQMANMRRALRAFAKKSSTSGGTYVIMWETVQDDVELDHATVKRSYDWCRYNSALSWIGPQVALKDVRVAEKNAELDEPLGALMWLKNEQVLKLLSTWDSNDKVSDPSQTSSDCEITLPKICNTQDPAIYSSLQDVIPDLSEKLFPVSAVPKPQSEHHLTMDPVQLPSHDRNQLHPLSFSSRGDDYTGLGCFQLGLDCSFQDFDEIVETQRRLRELNLLQPIKPEDIRQMAGQLHDLFAKYAVMEGFDEESHAISDLHHLIAECTDQNHDGLKVYTALHSGLRTSLSTQFWGLHDVDSTTGTMHIYVSAKTPDLVGTILHIYMSSRGFSRAQCFAVENMLYEQTHPSAEKELPPRMKLDIEQLTPAETILLLQRLKRAASSYHASSLLTKMELFCEYQLLEVPSLSQMRSQSSVAYLRGDATPEELIAARIAWYREQGCSHPDAANAVALFKAVDAQVKKVLRERQGHILSQLQNVLYTILKERPVDASADIFALSVFCAFRKLAVDEVYMEVLDRNPLPNGHSDQAACFAEMFATGSQCGAYFNMTPNVLGKIIADKYHAYYKINQPPQRDDHSTELPTAYASKQVDIDPDAVPLELPLYYQITFLGIFAVPALIDILLLTTIGRGLYLTAYMSQDEKLMATTALMISLFLVGAVGTWISSGGSYYLHSMAFPAMNMYVLSRLIAGVAVTLSGGFLAFVVIGIVKNFYLGFIFFAYFFLLSTYLTLLATLAIYQLPGFMFQSVS